MTASEMQKIRQPAAVGTFDTKLETGSDRAGDLTGAQATGANVDVFGRTVHDRFHAFDIGFPRTIGATMRVRHTDTEGHALSANITFSHTIGTSFWIRPIESGRTTTLY